MSVVVTTAATGRSLLTPPEMRAAVGVTDGSKDAALVQLEIDVAAALAKACNLSAIGVTPPTFRVQTYTETWLNGWPRSSNRELILTARPVIEIVSATEGGTAVAPADYLLDPGYATLTRLNSLYPSTWSTEDVVVVYRAGWEIVPDELKLAAKLLAASLWGKSGRDANLRRIVSQGISEREYFWGGKDNPLVPKEVLDLLGDFIEPVVG